jgi:hypothetical protein
VLASKTVTVPSGRTVVVRLKPSVLATVSRQSTPARRVRVRATGALRVIASE